MRVAIAFRAQANRDGCKNENGYSLFCWSEAEYLSRFIEFET
jgi:hypothetical protein